jgi:hypothetical protein
MTGIYTIARRCGLERVKKTHQIASAGREGLGRARFLNIDPTGICH